MVPTYGLWEDWFDSLFGAEKEQIFFVTAGLYSNRSQKT